MKDDVAANAPGETADQFEALRHYIEQFLLYLADEKFEAGRSWARGLVSKGTPDQFDSLNESENSRGYEMPPQLLDLPADQAFLMYAGNYFAARFKIEQSYLYQHAHELLALSQRFLAVANFFCFTNAVFNERVRSLTRNASQWSKLSGKGLKGLNKELAQTEAALHAVENFEHDVEKRLDTMESGHFMRFPDLTLLINRLFEQLGLPELTVQTRALLGQAREKNQQLRDRLTRAQDAVKARASERLSSIAAIIGALVGLAQIQPLLNLSKDLGYEISPTGQLAIYSSLLLIVLILLISGRIRRGS